MAGPKTDRETDQAVQDMKSSVRDEAGKAGSHVAEEAKAVASEAAGLGREHAERRFEQGKETIGSEVDAVGDALGDAAQRLHEQNSPLASYADEIAGQISSFSSTLQDTSLEGLATKTRRLARENPGLFFAGSVIAGIAASRFFKASDQAHRNDGSYGNDAYGNSYGTDSFRSGGGNVYGATGGGDRSDDYLEGRRAAMAGSVPDYRSPVTSTPQPRRDGTSTDSPSRVPMDSDDGSSSVSSSSPTTNTGDTNPAGVK